MLEQIFKESLLTKLHHCQILSDLSSLDEAKAYCFSDDFWVVFKFMLRPSLAEGSDPLTYNTPYIAYSLLFQILTKG